MSDLDEQHTLGFGGEFGADSPLWYRGLIQPEVIHLPEALCRTLREWSNTWQDHMGADTFDWMDGFDGLAHERTGDVLARAVAAEIGDQFQVRRLTFTIRSEAPALCPDAARELGEWIKREDSAMKPLFDRRRPGRVQAFRDI